MADAPATFSESWFRVAGQRICLRPSVRARRQNFRGQRWIVLENALSNQFFRLRPAAYEFVARLRPERTVEEVWKECLDRFPDEAPGQEAVIQLLAQLYQAGLLQYGLASDTAQLFKRYEKTRQRETRARWLNVMFIRLPLLDPDSFLVRAMPVARLILNPVGGLLWLAMICFGLKMAADNFPELREQSQGVLAPSNLPLLYLGMIMVKTLHEFGHAFFCRRYGGEVHVMGIMFMIFTPMPYVDATSSWGFRHRYQRVLVGAAGMIVELFVAAVAMLVWHQTAPGLVHSLAYNIIFVASVSTLVFNLNPLMRFDGYYILSDLIEIPNLNQRAMLQLRFWAERYLYGVRKAEAPALTHKEAVWLTVFGVCSGLYRVVVFGGILLLVADRFMLLGILMAVACLVAWIAVPTIGLIRYLAGSPRLDRCRVRAVTVTICLAAVALVLLQVVRFPSHFRAPGVLKSRQWTEVHNEITGYVEELLTKPGGTVTNGQPIARLSNPELALNLASAQASRAEIEARIRQAMKEQSANVAPLTSRLESATLTIQRLERDQASLIVRARQDGIWVSPQGQEFVHRWLPRGDDLGLIVSPAGFQFIATVGQEDADRLFAQGSSAAAQVRLHGEAGTMVPVGNIQIIPAERRNLPSPALGWAGGGKVALAPEDREGRRAAEPFFEVWSDVKDNRGATELHGRAGEVRFDLAPEPLLPRWIKRLRQLMQKRYQL